MELHLNLATLPLYVPILKWGVSVETKRYTVRPAFALYRARTALVLFSLHVVISSHEARKRERGIERLRKRQATMPHKNDLGYSRHSGESITVSRTPQIAAQLGHFQLLNLHGRSKRVYSACRFLSLSISRSLFCSIVANSFSVIASAVRVRLVYRPRPSTRSRNFRVSGFWVRETYWSILL